MTHMQSDIDIITSELIHAGQALHDLGMVPATSGNLSARLNDREIAITVSGVHKGYLTEKDFIVHAIDGVYGGEKQPSAETELHLQLYRYHRDINTVLHPHSEAATMTKDMGVDRIVLEGYEILKAFEGINSHEVTMEVPIFDNDQDIARLSRQVGKYLEEHSDVKAYIIRGHGFYTWGSSIQRTIQHCEALEFLLQCEFKSAGTKNQKGN